MSLERIINILVFVAGLAAGVAYVIVDNEAQGTVIVLLAILYFVAVPRMTRS